MCKQKKINLLDGEVSQHQRHVEEQAHLCAVSLATLQCANNLEWLIVLLSQFALGLGRQCEKSWKKEKDHRLPHDVLVGMEGLE